MSTSRELQPKGSADLELAMQQISISSGLQPDLADSNPSMQTISITMGMCTDNPVDIFADEYIYSEGGSYSKDGEKIAYLKVNVMRLLSDLSPSAEIESPMLKVLGQGSFNLVVGVFIEPKSNLQDNKDGYSARVSRLLGIPPKPQIFALRIPLESWFNFDSPLGSKLMGDINQDVAILRVVGRHLALPIPKVKECDVTSINALGRAYMLQTYIPGESLRKIWSKLNLDQKVSAIKQLTRIVEQIATVTTPAAGRIALSNAASSSGTIKLDRFSIPTEDQAKHRPDLDLLGRHEAPEQTPCEFLMHCCSRWMCYEELISQPASFNEELWDGITKIISSLQEEGWLGDRFHLMHGDFFPRNIMVEIDSLTTVKITGIVDWDMACFVPKIMALRSPFWAWQRTGFCESDEDCAKADACGPLGQVLKDAFLSTASHEYVTMASSDQGIIARKLFKVITGGLLTPMQREMANDVIEHWNRVCPRKFTQQPAVAEKLDVETS